MSEDRKSAEVKEVKQRIDEDLLLDLKQYPSQVKQFFTSNFLQRSLSYLVGLSDTNIAKMLRITNSGALKVASVGSGLFTCRTITGLAVAAESVAGISLPITSNKVILIAKDYDLYVRTSPDGFTYGDQIFVKGGTEKAIDLVVKAVKVQRAAANDANYIIEAYQ